MGSLGGTESLRGGGVLQATRPTRCLLLLQRCLAIRLQRVSTLVDPAQPPPPRPGHEYWIYDSGYRLFQSLLDANLRCFWNVSLLEAMRQLQFQGYVAPGVLLVSADACALEVIRAAWGRKTLQAPSNYVISLVGDVEECLVQSLPQSQFTPLPEALCWVVLELTSAGQPASLEAVRAALQRSFPSVAEAPSEHTVYDALAKLMQERKVYHTSRGYFVVTPESRRRRSNSSGRCSRGPLSASCSPARSSAAGSASELRPRTVLMSTDEALAYIHGEMETLRDGEKTHQAVQTNLADVICGGNPNDKVLYARVRPASSPAGRLLERRHSLRLFGSKKRLSQSASLPRCGSMRLSPLRSLDFGDSSIEVKPPEKSPSFLSRLFRRPGSARSKRRGEEGSDSGSLSTFSAQFPPAEWFNPSVVHLHSVGTQTRSSSYSLASTRQSREPLARSQGSLPWSDDLPSRAATLPRRRRHLSGDTNLTLPSGVSGSYSNTPRSSRKSSNAPSSNGTLPRGSCRTRSSSSSGSKLTGSSPGTSVTGAPSSLLSSPLRKASPSPAGPAARALPRLITPQASPSPPLPVLPPAMPLITLQVSSRTSPPGTNTKLSTSRTNGDVTTTATLQLQSPTRSVVTLNGSPVTPVSTTSESPKRRTARPSSLYSPREKKAASPASPPSTTTVYLSTAKRFPSLENLSLRNGDVEHETPATKKLTNTNNQNYHKPAPLSKQSNNEPCENQPSTPVESMNNIIDLGRKKSETLSSLKNLLYSSNTELNGLQSSNSSAFKSLDKSLRASDSLNLMENVGKSPCSPLGGKSALMQQDDDLILQDKDPLLHSSYPSLSDLAVHFKSLTAQKILKGISINSIDTLVEVNMAAAGDKPNNCDHVTLHTDFGMV